MPKPERVDRARCIAAEEELTGFDPSGGSLLRATLLQLCDEEYFLLLTASPLVWDARSTDIALRDILELYAADANSGQPDIRDLPVQYFEFADRQKESFPDSVLDKQFSYWKQRLNRDSIVLPIPTDRPRPAHWSFRSGEETLHLGTDVWERIAFLSERHRVAPSLVLLSAFQVLLHRYTEAEDLVVVSSLSQRTAETEPLIGPFESLVALRTGFSGSPTFGELLAQNRDVLREAQNHKELPFDQLCERLGFDRNAGAPPIFQTRFEFRHLPERALAPAGVSLQEELDLDPRAADFELTMKIIAGTQGCHCLLNYNAELFEAERIRRMIEHYQTLLYALVEDPDSSVSKAPLLGETERRRLLVEWNQTPAEYPHVCVHQLFEEQVRRIPDALAVIQGQRQLTYRQLNAAANQLARYLRTIGLGPDALVGICTERSVEMIVCLLGILKAGGAYVPLDPAWPMERLEFMLEDMRPSALLCSHHLVNAFQKAAIPVLAVEEIPQLTASQKQEDPHFPVEPDHLAYMLYTSGSTGQPKGVLVSHAALVNYLCWCATAYPVDQGRGSPLHSPIGFDLTITSLFPPLLAGRSVVLVAEDHTVEGLASILASKNFSLVKITPSHLEALSDLLSAEEKGALTSAFVIGGEALFGESLAFWRRQNPAVRLINEYGPTETTVGCCVYEVPPGQVPAGAVPIGRPISNVKLFVLDRNLQPVPIGVPGELYIGGNGLARGYHRRPDLTAERFIADPFSTQPGARLYKTGDLVRYQPDGNLQFLGRLDNQVKVRGFRIELHEVESTLVEYPDVREAVVCASGPAAVCRLVAYIVADLGRSPSEEDLRSFLKKKLPDYMLPAVYVFLDSFPLTKNGKVDRSALATLEPKHEPAVEFRIPHDSVESRLLGMWQEILQTASIGMQDNFFDLGGNSLSAARLIARIGKELNENVTVSALFQAPTIEQLAALLRDQKLRIDPRVSPIQPAGFRSPFFCIGAGPLFRALAKWLGSEQPFLGVNVAEPSSLPNFYRLEELAAYHARTIRETQPEGPYFLGGWSDSGIAAYEIARQLQRQGQSVALLVLFDSENEAAYQKLSGLDSLRARADSFSQWCRINWALLRNSETTSAMKLIRDGLEFRRGWLSGKLWLLCHRFRKSSATSVEIPQQNSEHFLRIAVTNYRPEPYAGRVVLFQRSARPRGTYHDDRFGWGGICKKLEIIEIPGDHRDMFLEPLVQILAEKLGGCLAEAQEAPPQAITSPTPNS